MIASSSSTILRTTVACIAVALACGGCATGSLQSTGRSKAEYVATFSAVMQKSFRDSSDNNVCLPPLFGYPGNPAETVEVNVDNEIAFPVPGTSRNTQLKALESVGLVVGTPSEKTIANKVQKVVTYRRTPLGDTYWFNANLCYARAELDTIVKWKGPLVLGDYQVAWVYYTTRTGRVAEWARAPQVMAAFPTVRTFLTETTPKVRQTAIDLSSEGWDIAEYAKYLQLQ